MLINSFFFILELVGDVIYSVTTFFKIPPKSSNKTPYEFWKYHKPLEKCLKLGNVWLK